MVGYARKDLTFNSGVKYFLMTHVHSIPGLIQRHRITDEPQSLGRRYILPYVSSSSPPPPSSPS